MTNWNKNCDPCGGNSNTDPCPPGGIGFGGFPSSGSCGGSSSNNGQPNSLYPNTGGIPSNMNCPPPFSSTRTGDQPGMSARQKLIRQLKLMIGEPMVRTGLHPENYDLAFDIALDRYRYRSSNSVSERWGFLTLMPGQNDFFLSQEVINVRQVFRRNTGGIGGGTMFEPFNAGFVNQILLPMTTGSGGQGSLVTYELYAQYQELLGKMFGLHVAHSWDSQSKRLTIPRMLGAPEEVLLWLYMYRTEEMLLDDTYARDWLREYALARAKYMIGEARSKFGNLGGPQGGVSLNGDALKQEAENTMQRLEDEMVSGKDADIGYGFVMG